MVVFATVLARLVARPLMAGRVEPAGVAAWVGVGAAWVGAGAADSVGIATGRDRPLSTVGDSRWRAVTASITRAPAAIFEDVPLRLPSLASDAPTIQPCMPI